MQNVSVVIPARGGSKGLPRKNVLQLCGKPLIAWNIEAALAAESVSHVYVSTDDAEIAEAARKYGASVIDRPAELASDTASSEAALLHAIDFLEINSKLPELLVFMQCTSPLTLAIDVDQAVRTLISQKGDSCLTVSDFHYFVWKPSDDGSAGGVNHDKRVRARRQDREAQYVENGAIYVMKTSGFKEAKHRFFGKTVLSIMPSIRSFEVDELIDFRVVEVLLREQVQEVRAAGLPQRISGVAFDFDGVMTDNRVWVDQNGNETVACNRSDGWGLSQLKKLGIPLVVLSTEINPVVAARCEKIGIECYQGLGGNKLAAFVNWCHKYALVQEGVVFVGNDDNDISCMNASGCGVVPSDAYPKALAAAKVVLKEKGGLGAVREICELIVASFHSQGEKK